MKAVIILLPMLCLLASCGGQTLKQGEATMSYTDEVQKEVAQKVFQRMIERNYNFASNLPEEVDRINGRLTLRLGNDNEDSIQAIMKFKEQDGAVFYMHGLARSVSDAVGGEPVDIILCRRNLGDHFYTVKWQSPKK